MARPIPPPSGQANNMYAYTNHIYDSNSRWYLLTNGKFVRATGCITLRNLQGHSNLQLLSLWPVDWGQSENYVRNGPTPVDSSQIVDTSQAVPVLSVLSSLICPPTDRTWPFNVYKCRFATGSRVTALRRL